MEHQTQDSRTRTPPPRLGDRIRRWGIVAWSLIGVLILAGVAGWALLQVREVFPPLVLALVLVYLLNPLVSGLERRGLPRLAGSCLTYTVFVGLLTTAVVLLAPLVIHQVQGFVKDAPKTFDEIAQLADRVTGELQTRFRFRFDLGEWVSARLGSLGDHLGSIGHFLLGAVQTLAWFVIGPVIAFYLLVDLPRLQRAAMRLFPPHRRQEVTEVAGMVGSTMGNFFRGQLLVAITVGILSSLALRMVGLPYYLVVGMIAGFFNLIPLVGPFIGAVPGILIAAAFKPPITMVWVALALTVVQQIDNHFISPNVMRFTVRLHPVTVMVSLILGATLAGFWGMLLAVPTVASSKVVAGHVWRTRVWWGPEVFDDAQPAPEAATEEMPTGLE